MSRKNEISFDSMIERSIFMNLLYRKRAFDEKTSAIIDGVERKLLEILDIEGFIKIIRGDDAHLTEK
jgi:hypothetical protein